MSLFWTYSIKSANTIAGEPRVDKGPKTGHALGVWICGCSLFYKRELWASKSAGALSTKSLKISGCKR